MKNANNEEIKAGYILAESYNTPIEERIIVVEDFKSDKLYWRRLMGDVSVKNPLNTLEGNRYITLQKLYSE